MMLVGKSRQNMAEEAEEEYPQGKLKALDFGDGYEVLLRKRATRPTCIGGKTGTR